VKDEITQNIGNKTNKYLGSLIPLPYAYAIGNDNAIANITKTQVFTFLFLKKKYTPVGMTKIKNGIIAKPIDMTKISADLLIKSIDLFE
jgi:hypothetical protein